MLSIVVYVLSIINYFSFSKLSSFAFLIFLKWFNSSQSYKVNLISFKKHTYIRLRRSLHDMKQFEIHWEY